MGKKYDAYVKAKQASDAAELRVAEVQGGSTWRALGEAYVNADQAKLAEDEAWKNLQEDPEG